MSVSDYDSMSYRKYTKKSEFDKAVHTLIGIINGIALDNEITAAEMDELKHWCIIHKHLSDKYPFKELIDLIDEALIDNELTSDEIEDILWVCNNYRKESKYYDLITTDLQELQGILHGIMADDEITENEIRNLKAWLENNTHLTMSYPYDEIYSLIVAVLSDGVLDEEEIKMLKVFFTDFIDTRNSYNINSFEIEKLKKEIHIDGICAMCPDVVISGNTFCFTGKSLKATRSEIESAIVELGGNFIDSVSKNINYLIIGNDANPCWVFSCYGRKVEKAIDLRKKGCKIVIVNENDFWDAIADSAV